MGFVLVGLIDGKLSAVYHKNGNRVFSTKISDASITAVCCEEEDDVDNPIFYAGDSDGKIYTVNKKGNIVAETVIPNRKGEIHILANRGKYSLYAYTSNGTTSFSRATSDFRKGNFSTSSSNYSYDGDGTFHRKMGAGDYKVIQFDGRTPSRVVATVGLEFGKKLKNYEQVHVYAVVDDEYENLIEDGTAEKTLQVMNQQSKKIRELNFNSPVKQVMSCRHHHDDAENDKIYIMLWNGQIFSVTGNMLADESVSDDALDLKLAVQKQNDTDVDDDDDDQGELRGFCVYGKKIIIYGNDGLMIGDIQVP